MASTRLDLTRQQILAYRRRVGALDQRLPRGKRTLGRVAYVGLQDSMPRAAVLSIHARMEGTSSNSWEDPTLVQLWGPRFSVFVVAADDRAIFTLGRLPDDPKRRRIGEDLADRLEAFLGGARMPFGEAARGLAAAARGLGEMHLNSLRYAAPTGRVLIRWDGARQPEIWIVPAPEVDPTDARLELARRYLHIFGPSTPEAFGLWAGIRTNEARAAFDALASSLVPVATPIGDALILPEDEADLRSDAGRPATARLLPSGDAYYLLQGPDRELLVPDPDNRNLLWTSRVWPGAVLVDGEIVGTWRRSKTRVLIHPWRRLARAAQDNIENEARSMPIPDADDRDIVVDWENS